MELFEFIHRENLRLYAKQLETAAGDAQRRQLLNLLTEEQQRGQKYSSVVIENETNSAPA
jgi:hypothetical protein